ncbi:adenylate/guanylate cyclase domain-containing protein [Aurantimonas marina]|uniref:adenylate/guanylate cyclase domain-containing protein n=1 Tax=Aurantimonas marina TaxID=2780508 RepID=UPI0019D12B26|nr:adenylate/guanylate cyclase domain-containing protein [Aurantimonas marina]
MSKRAKLVSPFAGRRTAAAIPDRVQEVVAEFEAVSERLIGWVQFAIGVFITLLYLISPRPSDALMQQPVPVSLAIYLAFTALRLFLSYRIRLPGWFLVVSMLVDIALLYGLIWYFHIQYGQSAGFSLQAPTVMYVFIFIAIRALRFDPIWVISIGAIAALGWVGMTFYAIHAAGMQAITRSFVEYIQSDRILVGAEIDKIVAILVLTIVLALALTRAKRLLAAAVLEHVEREEIRRFLPADVERAITKSPVAVVAGDAEERDAAIIVLDIRGFTRFVEANEPKRVVAALVGLHALIVPIIQRHGGIVDKYLGDGLLATFGATSPSHTAAADALRALVEIMDVARQWSRRMSAEHGDGSLRVNGAATAGPVVFAALGDEFRLEYTVIGDAVNLAAKLEKHNKAEATSALTTRSTYDLACIQGFSAAEQVTQRVGCRVAGVEKPTDLVVMAA